MAKGNKKTKKENVDKQVVDNKEVINKKNKNKDKKNKDSDAVKKYKKMKNKKNKRKPFDGKFTVDILDILIVIIITAIVSCVTTGFILNKQYKKNFHLSDEIIRDENVQNFLNIYSEIVDNYYEEVDSQGMIKAATTGMINFLQDTYSIYLDENQTEDLSESLDGTYQGIGIVEFGNVVYNVYEGSPAQRAGIQANDVIVKVNGTEITDKNYQIVSSLIFDNEENEIVVKRGEELLTFKINVDKVNVPSVDKKVIESKNHENDIGYIVISSFTSRTVDEFEEALIDIEKDDGIKGLIIDLRGNTGGYVTGAYGVASMFLEKGSLVYSLKNKDEVTDYKDKTAEKRDYKIVVLVNSNTASASEILAAALHDSYGATIVGNKTYGKGKVQTVNYYNNAMVKYTSGIWLRPNGESIDEVGIKPDYEVSIEIEKNTIYDKQYDKALELLK